METPTTYTPEQVAKILQLSTATIYELIDRGEITAKKYGKVFRIPAISLSFVFTGLDPDIQRTVEIDEEHLPVVTRAIKKVRRGRPHK